jgi:hypothetical protein
MQPDPINLGIKVGDVLTSLSILISLVALLIAWAKDRQIRKRDQADRVRKAAAQIIAKLERWKELNIWFFQAIQPSLVKTSEMLADDFNIGNARDYLWKELNAGRLQTQEKILNEQIEMAYVELYGYHPGVHDLFVSTFDSLKQKEKLLFNMLLSSTEIDVKSFMDKESEYTTDSLGDALRKTCYDHAQILKAEVKDTIKPIHTYLYRLISATDKEVLRKDQVLIQANGMSKNEGGTIEKDSTKKESDEKVEQTQLKQKEQEENTNDATQRKQKDSSGELNRPREGGLLGTRQGY